MADDHQQPGAVGGAGRSERVATAEVGRAEPGARHAEKTQGSPTLTVNATPASAASAPPPVRPEDAAPSAVFTPASIDLSPLDPRQNGVLEALARIERNTAASKRPGGGIVGRDSAGRAVVNSRPGGDQLPADSAGRVTTPQAIAGQAGGTSGLQQRIRRVKRVERRVERTLPPADPSAPAVTARTGAGASADGEASPDAGTAANAVTRRKAAEAEADATAAAIKEQQAVDAGPARPSDGKSPAEASAPALTEDDLRKLPLRGEGGRFLSRDEKQGMSKAELAQARARENREKNQEEDETRGALGKLSDVAREAMTGNGNATDAAGTAVGNSYYLAAKEVYDAASELGGKDSKAQRLYRWAQKKRDERAGNREGDDSDNATPVQQADPDKAAKQRRQTADAVQGQAEADAKQREAAAQQKAATAEARESQHRADVQQADRQHDDNQQSLDDLEKTTEEGFEDVVDAIKRYSGGGGDDSIIPWPGGRGRGGARGGGRRAGARRAGKAGFFRRTWDKLRPGGKASTATKAAKAGQAAKTAKAGATAAKAAKTTSTAARAAGATAKTSRAAKVSAKAVEAAKATRAGQAATKTAQVSKGAIQAAKATKVGGAVAKAGSTTAKVAGTTAKAGGRLLGAAAAPITGYLAYKDAQADMAKRDDLTDKQKTVVAGSSAAGAGGGALAGAGAGAAVGAAALSVVPGIGTAIGGALGGVIGGALGAWGGEKAGREVGNAVADTMDNVEEEAKKHLEEREKRLRKEEGKADFKWYNPATWTNRGGAGTSRTAPVNQGDYTAGGDAELANETGFGRVAEKYESSGMGVGTVSSGKNDKGGVSYGIHQLASDTGTMQAFLDSKEGEAYRDQFAGMRAGSHEFTAKYKEIAASDGDNFADAQQDFIKRTHYDPVEKYARAKGLDTDSEAIQEMLYSQSVQSSGRGNRKIIDDAMSRVGPDATEEEIIDAMYDARGDYVEPHVTYSAGRGRYAKERKDIKAIAARKGKPEVQAPEPVTASNQGAQPPAATAPESPGSPAPPAAIAAPVEPSVQGDPVEPIDPEKAQAALQPKAPPAQIARAPAPAKAAPTQGPAGNDGKQGSDGTSIRGGTSAPGVNDIQMGFDDTVLTLMAMDRI